MKKTEHNKKVCECKKFFGMKDGHCMKCGGAFKNCDICFPEYTSKKGNLYKVSYAWTNIGEGNCCAWCGKNQKDIKDPNDHIEAHDHTQKQVSKELRSKVIGAIMAVGFAGGFTQAKDGLNLIESVSDILGDC